MDKNIQINKPICVIPARSGSTRLKNKNILPLLPNGITLLQHTVHCAINSNFFSSIIVSSDCHEYLNSCPAGLNLILHLRDKKYAQTETPMEETLKHILSEHKINYPVKIVLWQPTSPFRLRELHKEAINTIDKHKHYVVIKRLVHPNYTPYPTGSFYGYYLKNINSITQKTTSCDILTSDRLESIDIDTQQDMDIAKLLVTSLLYNQQYLR